MILLHPGRDNVAVTAWADGVFQGSAGSTAHLLRLAFPRRGFARFSLLYAYFRWADDIVDVPDRTGLAPFVAHQSSVLAGSALPLTVAERALHQALQGTEGQRLGPVAAGMWAALAHDASRTSAPISDADLQLQINRVGDAYLGALWVCSGAPGSPPPDLRLLSRAATATHQLRDLEADLALGYCNVPASFDGGDRSRVALAPWVLDRCDAVQAWFVEGQAALAAAAPPLRARLALEALGRKYARVLRAVRTDWSA